jgi:PAS domain S-box-containing protein
VQCPVISPAYILQKCVQDYANFSSGITQLAKRLPVNLGSWYPATGAERMDRGASKVQPGSSPLAAPETPARAPDAQRLQILAEVTEAISGAGLDREAIASALAQRTAELIGDTCTLLLRSDDGRVLKSVACYATDPSARQFIRSFPALVPSVGDGQDPCRRVVETAQAVLIPRVEMEHLRPLVRPEAWSVLRRFGPRSVLLVPLQADGRPVGVLYLSRYRADAPPYDDRDEQLVRDLAGRAATALAGARAHADLKAKLRQAERGAHDLREASQQRAMDRAVTTRDAESLLETLIASSPFVVWRADATDLSVTYISPNVERVLAHSVDEVLMTPGFWSTRIHPADVERFRAAVSAAAEDAAPQLEVEHRVIHKDGSTRWLYTLAGFERAQAGARHSLLGFSLDITARKATEETLEQARLDAERANQAKSEFLSRMSHELRTPLNAVLGFAQLLEMDTLSPEQHENLGYILKAGRHLLDLINEVLDIARIEAGRMAISPESVALTEVAQEALVLTVPLAAERAVKVRSHIAGTDGHYVLADRQRVKQVLLNLLSNAVKYNHVGGEVVIADELVGDRVRITVTDTGSGIPADRQERLFIPFERLGTVQGGVEGTGLGLALSKRLTEAMGGAIGVYSEVGRGSTFWIELPLTDPPPVGIDRMAEDARARAVGTPSDRTFAVLYIEDDLANLGLIERLLARRPSIRVIPAMQGRIGLNLAREHQPDLILLDMQLPDVPGSEILHRLQADLRTRLIPVVTMSSDPSPEQVERLLASGAHACLAKPVDVKELMIVLDDILRRRNE